MKSGGGVKGFLGSRIGFWILVALATAAVVLSVAILADILIAIVAILLFGLGLPIWLGHKRFRNLAIAGVVILVASAPLINLFEAQDIMTPSPLACTTGSCSGGASAGALQNATVTPYNAASGSTFNWTVSVFPAFLPNATDQPLWLWFNVSNCAGSFTSYEESANACPSPFTDYNLNFTVPAGFLNGTTHTFTQALGGGVQIWNWQIFLFYRDNTTHALEQQSLAGNYGTASQSSVLGPVTGFYWDIYDLILSDIYLTVLIYLGAPFFIVLLIYVFLKSRRDRRADEQKRAMAADAPVLPPPSSPGAGTGTTPAAAPLRPLKEVACPNCGAVVYPGERVCWKCGAAIPTTLSGGTSAPLPSAPKG